MSHANVRTNLFVRRLIVERVAAGWRPPMSLSNWIFTVDGVQVASRARRGRRRGGAIKYRNVTSESWERDAFGGATPESRTAHHRTAVDTSAGRAHVEVSTSKGSPQYLIVQQTRSRTSQIQ